LGCGGVDWAIHRAAVSVLVRVCRMVGGCNSGEAKFTKGYNLPALYFIHTVGPVWNGGNNREAELLASCYRRSLEIAGENKFNSLAFPCISTGIYGFPNKLAAETAVKTCQQEQNNRDLKIIFCCLGQEDYEIYQSIL
ncbi:MAG: macro domain-containing protein, partial [Pleurocapsa sp.]